MSSRSNIFVFLFIVLLFNTTVASELDKVRKLFFDSFESEQNNKSLLQLLNNKSNLSTIESVYLGATMCINAKYKSMPWDKLASFNKGKELIDNGIKKDINNTEARLIRLLIQRFSPDFLGYNDHKKTDNDFILTNLNDLKQRSNYVYRWTLDYYIQDKETETAKREELIKLKKTL